MPGEHSTGRTRIFAVVVLYGQRPAESTTVSTLAQALRVDRSCDCSVLLYDNSPSAAEDERDLPQGFAYLRAAANQGLYGAYENGRLAAEAQGCEWLLTLDQDTALPDNFFSLVESGLQAARLDPRIAAIVPHLAEGERLLSPAYVGIGRPKPIARDFAGVPRREARAFNSAALLRVAALKAIGGFDPRFWLDHLDSWLHHQLFLHHWHMYVLPLRLEHHFSLLNYRERVSTGHLRNFLAAESAYVDLYGSAAERFAYTAQLGLRVMNQMRRREPEEIRRLTRAALRRRLVMRKQRRIMEWTQSMADRQSGADSAEADSSGRP